jgi:hypothetical protein
MLLNIFLSILLTEAEHLNDEKKHKEEEKMRTKKRKEIDIYQKERKKRIK